MTIPTQLWNEEFRFCLIRKQSKAPFEKDWANKGYKFNDTKLLNHLYSKGNYGVIGGHGDLIILDKDSNDLEIDLDTFCVETGSGGKHYYLLSDYKTNHVFINELGELRANNYQCVGAGSIHPNGQEYKVFKDLPIKRISSEELQKLIKPYLREEQTTTNTSTGKDTSGSGLEFRRVLAMIRQKKSRELIYKEMMNYRKWSSAKDDYRNTTYNKAMDIFIGEGEGETKVIEETYSLDEAKKHLQNIYQLAKTSLAEFVDVKPIYHTCASVWAIGTYFHDKFESYPYLFLNAMKGSGKTRTLKLIMKLSEGMVANSMTEAVLFRTKGAIAIDEFEGIGRKGQENLRELLNASYKKGSVVYRMTKKKTIEGEEQVADMFLVYRPIALANIWGMEEVLGDRTIPLILEKSDNPLITRRLEDFDNNKNLKEYMVALQKIGGIKNSLFSKELPISNMWNEYINSQHSQHSQQSHNSHNSLNTLFSKIEETGIYGRELELFFPLFVVGYYLGEEVLDDLIDFSKEIIKEKKENALTENYDVRIIDFVSQSTHFNFVSMKELIQEFREFTDASEEEFNSKWLGRRLKTLVLIKEKKKSSGIFVRLDIEKAQQKIKMFDMGEMGVKGVSGVKKEDTRK